MSSAASEQDERTESLLMSQGVNLAMVGLYALSLKGSRAGRSQQIGIGRNNNVDIETISVKKSLTSVNLVGSQ